MSDFIKKDELIWQKNREIDQFFLEAVEKQKDERVLTDEEKYILERIIAKNGITLFTGYYGCGKSWLILFLIKNLLQENFLNYKVYGNDYKVLYLTENPREIVNERKRILDFNSSNFFVIGGKRILFDYQEERERVYKNMIAYGMNILILDPMRLYFSGDENKSHVIRAFFDGLRKDFCQKGISVILTHHRGKAELNYNELLALEKKPKSLPSRGSSDIGASCDIIFNIRRTPRKDRFEVVMEQDKNVLDTEIEPLVFDFTDMPNVVFRPYSYTETITEKFKEEFEETIKNSEEGIYREEALQMMSRYGGSRALFDKIIARYKEEEKIRSEKENKRTKYKWIGKNSEN
jgi:hypothetical protein